MTKKKILIIENSIHVTGALKSIVRTAYDLRESFDFHFLIPRKSKGRFWIEGKGFPHIQELPMKEISRRFFSLLLYIPFLIVNAFRLKRIVKQSNISIIHLNDLYNLLPVILRLLGNRVPYICHIRFLPDRFSPWLFNFWLRLHLKHASKVIAVSQSVLNQLPLHPKLVLIHNELPVEERYPELTTLSTHKTVYTFLYLSNIIKGKGQEYALEAFASIHQDLPNWRLRFVGGDMGLKKNKAFKKRLREKAKILGILEKTEWCGFTEEVEWEYKRADIVLNFSESESFSITCLESLYYGRPIIASDCGGPVEIIDHFESGLLVKNKDVSEMADAMRLLAKDSQLRRQLADEGHKRSREKFSLEKTSLRVGDIYNSVSG